MIFWSSALRNRLLSGWYWNHLWCFISILIFNVTILLKNEFTLWSSTTKVHPEVCNIPIEQIGWLRADTKPTECRKCLKSVVNRKRSHRKTRALNLKEGRFPKRWRSFKDSSGLSLKSVSRPIATAKVVDNVEWQAKIPSTGAQWARTRRANTPPYVLCRNTFRHLVGWKGNINHRENFLNVQSGAKGPWLERFHAADDEQSGINWSLRKLWRSSKPRLLIVFSKILQWNTALLVDTGVPPLTLIQHTHLAQMHFRLTKTRPGSRHTWPNFENRPGGFVKWVARETRLGFGHLWNYLFWVDFHWIGQHVGPTKRSLSYA